MARFSNLIVNPKQIVEYTLALPARRPSGIAGHNPLEAISVIFILLILSIQVVTGLFSEDDGLFYSGPFTHLLSSKIIVKMTAIHNLFANFVLAIVGLHVAAVFFYLIWKKENLIKAMITGNKLVKSKTEKEL